VFLIANCLIRSVAFDSNREPAPWQRLIVFSWTIPYEPLQTHNNLIYVPLMKNPTLLEPWLKALDSCLRISFSSPRSVSAYPAKQISGSSSTAQTLSEEDRKLSGALMRINHVGEVCAQALYRAQALSSSSPEIKTFFERAQVEEYDHLAWTHQRLTELGDRPSVLNPLWYAGAFAFGFAAGRLGKKVSLGFVLETERQVEAHLINLLNILPERDWASRAIVHRMAQDESNHGAEAAHLGGIELPIAIKVLMKAAAKTMTTVAHFV
jgi:ubiquinone biosynthesis monooxygenase Coq7